MNEIREFFCRIFVGDPFWPAVDGVCMKMRLEGNRKDFRGVFVVESPDVKDFVATETITPVEVIFL